MKKILLFGSTGNLGKEIAKEAIRRDFDLTVVVRNSRKAEEMRPICSQQIIEDFSDPKKLSGICDGFDIVISSLGKSVSPNDRSKPGFREVDFGINSLILSDALKNKVSKFVYVSALHAEKYPHLEYFRTHHDFSEKLIHSGIDYSIVKPPAIFCAFKDIMDMAKKGQLVNLGKGDKLTNPIYEGDLAKAVIEAVELRPQTIEVGGKEIYSRKQLNEIIRDEIRPGKKLLTVPLGLVKTFLPVLRVFDKNTYDKIAFFTEVMQHDTIAPLYGEMSFEDYVKLNR